MNTSEVIFRSIGNLLELLLIFFCLLWTGRLFYRAMPISRPPIEVSVESGGWLSPSRWVVRTHNTSSETIRVKMVFADPKAKKKSRLHSFDIPPNGKETTGRIAWWNFNPGNAAYVMVNDNHKVLVARFRIENGKPVLHTKYTAMNLEAWDKQE